MIDQACKIKNVLQSKTATELMLTEKQAALESKQAELTALQNDPPSTEEPQSE